MLKKILVLLTIFRARYFDLDSLSCHTKCQCFQIPHFMQYVNCIENPVLTRIKCADTGPIPVEQNAIKGRIDHWPNTSMGLWADMLHF